jgi:hypothetical protein
VTRVRFSRASVVHKRSRRYEWIGNVFGDLLTIFHTVRPIGMKKVLCVPCPPMVYFSCDDNAWSFRATIRASSESQHEFLQRMPVSARPWIARATGEPLFGTEPGEVCDDSPFVGVNLFICFIYFIYLFISFFSSISLFSFLSPLLIHNIIVMRL